MAHGPQLVCQGASGSNPIGGHSSVNVAGFLFPLHIVYSISNTIKYTTLLVLQVHVASMLARNLSPVSVLTKTGACSHVCACFAMRKTTDRIPLMVTYHPDFATSR